MINTVEKIYLNSVWTNEYKVTFVDNTLCTVPHDETNRHYQEILVWDAIDGNTITEAD